MTGVALPLVVLGHEGDRLAVLGGDLLRHRLEDRVIVGGSQGVDMTEADLMLSPVTCAPDRFDIHTCCVRYVADLPQQRLEPATAKDRVVDAVLVGQSKITIVSAPGILVTGVKRDELQLGTGQYYIVPFGRRLQLLLQDHPG